MSVDIEVDADMTQCKLKGASTGVRRLAGFLISVALVMDGLSGSAFAQQLDTDELLKVSPVQAARKKVLGTPSPSAASPNPDTVKIPAGFKPLTASVSRTLYLPPAMYGQWTVTGTVRETNIADLIPVANDIWVLQREGDAVTITNPTNGASAAINVDAVNGDTATFHRAGVTDRVNRSELVTLTVQGDSLYGKNLRREEVIRKGKVVRVNYAVFELQGTRISGASAVFRPELRDAGPDIEIEDVRSGFR
ncbi:hypothetical protein [Vampirovibrio sp.]|uniref:hypothetical protein n=1 Tax=Vampirovibrio sp. TaxID=2717857 RepID=UPI003593CC01